LLKVKAKVGYMSTSLFQSSAIRNTFIDRVRRRNTSWQSSDSRQCCR